MPPRTALQPEQIGDVDEGFTPEPTEQLDEQTGLTPEERAAFDEMREADRGLAQEPEEAPDEAAPEPGTREPQPQTTAPQAPPGAKKQPPREEPEEPDEPDQITRDPRTGREQRTISYGKHQRLMNKIKAEGDAFRAQLEEGRINQAKLAERLAILNDALTAPPPQRDLTSQEMEYARQQEILQNPMLEDTIDPSVDLGAAIGQLQRRQIFMANVSMQQQDATQEQLADQVTLQNFTRDAEMFSRTQEGQGFFGAEGAYQFLKNSRLVELGISLFDKDPTDPNEQFTQAEINKMISDFNQEEKWVVNNALQSGKSPAKAIMRLAAGRGWKPPQPPAAAAGAAPPARRQAPPPLARSPVAAPSTRNAVAQIQAEAAGAAASRSLSDGGGVPPAEPLSIEQLLRMDDETFGSYIDSLPKGRLDSIMGRENPTRH